MAYLPEPRGRQQKPWDFLAWLTAALLLALSATRIVPGLKPDNFIAPFRTPLQRVADATETEKNPEAVIAYLIRRYDEATPEPVIDIDELVEQLSNDDVPSVLER